MINRFLNCLVIALACLAKTAAAGQDHSAAQADPHRNEAGFFDIHVCNWPDRPLFFMALFSTLRYREVASVEVLDPDGAPIGDLDTDKYRLVKTANAQEKRAFISRFELPPRAGDGWYTGIITLKDGTRHTARDYVSVQSMDRASAIHPPDRAENIALPAELSWHAVKGARFYQVFIRDEWQGRLVYESELLSENRLPLPAGTLQKGGYYSWIIHARDVNEDIRLGDFNHGSLSARMTFSVADDELIP